jgi:ATP synthase protein I
MTDNEPESGSHETRREQAQSIGALSTVGISFVLAIVIGAWFGYVLDKWLGTGPWCFLLFFLLGVVAGVVNVYRTATRYIK